MMPPSGGAAQTGTGHSYQTYQDFSYEEGGEGQGGGGMAAGGYDYDAAYDDEYPPQQPYPHPGIRGLQDEEGELDNRAGMAQMSAEQRQAAMEAAQRSQSSKRYQEMERERKRRQLKTAGGENGKTSFLQTAKLGLMNSGIISLKKAG